jgi:kumamolisin
MGAGSAQQGVTMHKFTRSFRAAPDAPRVADVDPAAPVRIVVVLRPASPVVASRHVGGNFLTHAEYAAQHASDPGAMASVTHYAQSQGLSVEPPVPGSNQLVLTGTYGQAIAAFRPEQIGVYEANGRRFVARTGHLSVPEEVAGQIVAVMGFDQRPVAKPHFRMRAAAGTSYTPPQVAAAYQFPAGLDGAGQTIALIELGGGYDETQVAAYFSSIGVTRTGTLTSIAVDGATNTPGDPNGADGEVQLDIEVAGAVAPGANIAVYFGPNQGTGFNDAIAAAVNDMANSPAVMSISWGGPEDGYAGQDLDAMNQTLAKAMAMGITVCVASGDNGASDGETDGQDHVDFPASSPNVLGCGGTSLPPGGPEVAWNDGAQGGASGGGYSAEFPRPSWQTGNSHAQRGVPDVAGDADPDTGYAVSVDGTSAVIGGTSAVAPLWAGLIALVNQSAGKRSGFVNPTLYANPGAFTDITSGNNNGFSAGPGWDPVTGLGSPVGMAVLSALGGALAPET